MDKQLWIRVIGASNTGKTTVAHIIKTALMEHGFTNIHFKDTDPTPNKEHIALRVEKTKARRIDIEVIPVQREPL